MQWFRNLSIGSKLTLGFGSILILFTVTIGFAMFELRRVQQSSNQVAMRSLPAAVAAFEMNIAISEVSQYLTDVSATDRAAVYADAEKTAKQFKESLAAYIQIQKDENDTASLKDAEALGAAFDSYYAQGKIMAAVYMSQGKEAGNKQMEYFDKAHDTLSAIAEKLSTSQVREAKENSLQTVHELNELITIMLCVGFGAILLALIAALAITRGITRPINSMKFMLMDIAQGEGDLTKRLDDISRDELGESSRWFNLFIEKLHGIIGKVSGNTTQVASAAHRLMITANQIATGAEYVAAQARIVAAAGGEMAATTNEIAQNCQLAAEGSHHASGTASAGAEIVATTVQVMNRIADRVTKIAQTVGNLSTHSDQIGKIVGTIQDIADQTNLLALNAAIEAARAGEQGRGFAVVADEVRLLATRTTKATSEIGEMIKTIQNEIKFAVAAMQEGVKEVESGTDEAAKSGQALQDILEQINAVSMQVNRVAAAVEDQTATTSEISNNMNHITDAVHETARGAQESAGAAGQLTNLSEELRLLMGQFKL